MDTEVVLCVLLIIELEVPKGDIAHCHIKEVIRELCFLKAADLDFGIRI